MSLSMIMWLLWLWTIANILGIGDLKNFVVASKAAFVVPVRLGPSTQVGPKTVVSTAGKQLAIGLRQQISQNDNRNVSTRTNEKQLRTWEDSFQLLVKFKEENGHCNVPSKYKQDSRLGNWVNNQRASSRKGTLKEDRQAKLESIGFSWNARQDSWNDSYKKLMKYKENHGDCNVPYDWPNDKMLSWWVGTQRANKDCLSDDRRSKLDRLGFSWNMTRTWDELYEELIQYKEEHGDCNVPHYSKLNPALSLWVINQRRRKAFLSSEQRSKLEAIDFAWENSREIIYDKQWHGMLVKLKNYRRDHGDCHVPHNWSKDPSLGSWVRLQRYRYSQGLLETDRVQELNKLDFTWRLKSAVAGDSRNDERQRELWLEKYEALEDFKEAHGHVNVPRSYNATLFNWVGRQRRVYREGHLREDRKNMLVEIGFEWSVQGKQQDKQWLQRFSEYKSFVESKDRLSMTEPLESWINNQRLMHANGKLKTERKALLDDIGFTFAKGEPYMPS